MCGSQVRGAVSRIPPLEFSLLRLSSSARLGSVSCVYLSALLYCGQKAGHKTTIRSLNLARRNTDVSGLRFRSFADFPAALCVSDTVAKEQLPSPGPGSSHYQAQEQLPTPGPGAATTTRPRQRPPPGLGAAATTGPRSSGHHQAQERLPPPGPGVATTTRPSSSYHRRDWERLPPPGPGAATTTRPRSSHHHQAQNASKKATRL